MQIRFLFFAVGLFLLLPSCKKHTATIVPEPGMDTTQTYFSIRQYAQDQIETNWNEPLTLNRFEYVDGKVDSTMVNFQTLDWGPVYKAFLSSDISAVKYLGHYKFDRFEDNRTGNFTLSWDAKELGLFTRTLQITVDPTNNRILNVYIQTRNGSLTQKLLYVPLKVIQIQQDDVSWTGTKRNYRLEYRFLE